MNGFIGSNARIAGDDEVRAVVNNWLESLNVNPVALLAANRNIVNDIRSQGLKGLHKDRCGGLTVHIKVAPNADHLIRADCLTNDLYRFFNSRERRGWKRVGMKERARGFRRIEAALDESLRDQRRQVEVRKRCGDIYRRRINPASHKIVPR